METKPDRKYFYIEQFYRLSTPTRAHFPRYPGGFPDAYQCDQSM